MEAAIGSRALVVERDHREGQLAIVLAAMAWSTAGLIQRDIDAGPATQVAGRALFAALMLVLVLAVFERRGTVGALLGMGRWGVAAAVLQAISGTAFILALNHTTVANVLFMQAVAPLLAAVMSWLLLSEPVGRRTGLAVAIALLGISLMVGDSLNSGFAAVGLPFLMTAAFAGVIVVTRHRKEVSMLPATCASQVLVVLALAAFTSVGSVSDSDWVRLALLGSVQIGLGLALLSVGARVIPATEVALISLLAVVLGPLWVWLAYAETPAQATLLGGAIVMVAVVWQATSGRREGAQ